MTIQRGKLDPDGCEALCAAVVGRAARDYVNVLRRLKKNKDSQTAKAEKAALRRFFLSPHFSLFTDLDGEEMLTRIEREFEEKKGKVKLGWMCVALNSAKDL